MDQYMVNRALDNWEPGTIVGAGAFVDQRRINNLVDSRFLTKMSGKYADPNLLSMPVAELRRHVPKVDNINILSAALKSETRNTAKTILEARIRGLSNAE